MFSEKGYVISGWISENNSFPVSGEEIKDLFFLSKTAKAITAFLNAQRYFTSQAPQICKGNQVASLSCKPGGECFSCQYWAGVSEQSAVYSDACS